MSQAVSLGPCSALLTWLSPACRLTYSTPAHPFTSVLVTDLVTRSALSSPTRAQCGMVRDHAEDRVVLVGSRSHNAKAARQEGAT
jgi:hypothetical protein